MTERATVIEVEKEKKEKGQSWWMALVALWERWRIGIAHRLLLSLEGKEQHVKNWRPHLLLINIDHESRSPVDDRRQLLALAEQLKEGKGLNILTALVKGELGDPSTHKKLLEVEQIMSKEVTKVVINVHVLALPYENEEELSEAASALMQCVGLGVLTPNTVVVRYPAPTAAQFSREQTRTAVSVAFWDKMISAEHLNMCMIIVKGEFYDKTKAVLSGTVDIWWILHSGGLILLLGFLLRKNRRWSKCKLRIFAVAEKGDDAAQMKERLITWLYHLRIDASVTVVPFARRDIPDYATSRTEDAQLRSQYLNELKLTEEERKLQPQLIADTAHLKASREKLEAPKGDDDTQEDDTFEPYLKADSLNRSLRELSGAAQLVIVNVPQPPEQISEVPTYMDYLDMLTHDIPRMLLVRGTDKEVITHFS